MEFKLTEHPDTGTKFKWAAVAWSSDEREKYDLFHRPAQEFGCSLSMIYYREVGRCLANELCPDWVPSLLEMRPLEPESDKFQAVVLPCPALYNEMLNRQLYG